MATPRPVFDHLVKLDLSALSYDEKVVLRDVQFAMDYGELVYLLGSTGSGKSTLLRTLYADLEPGAGMAEVAGYDLRSIKTSEVSALRRKLGIIFQDFQLLTDRTVSENLRFVLSATGWSNPQLMQRRVIEVLKMVGLEDSAGKMPHSMSGGEQQRVVIARALLNEPMLLIADEPTGNLDFEIAQSIMRILQRIAQSGTGVIIATHDMRLVEGFPGRVIQIQDATLAEARKG